MTKFDTVQSVTAPESFSIIGTGRLGSHFALGLANAGLNPVWLISRTGRTAENLSKILGAQEGVHVQAGTLEDITRVSHSNEPGSLGDMVIISVPDDELAAVAGSLSRLNVLSGCRTVLHTSGALTSSVLDALRVAGRSVGSLHPLQTFVLYSGVPRDPAIFTDLPLVIEGDDDAVACGFFVADALGAAPVEVDEDAKILYHAAAVFSSNFITTLLGAVQGLLQEIPGQSEMSIDLFRPLAEQALRNTFDDGPENALTGPIVRGDIDLLRSHLLGLEEKAPDLLEVYVSLALETVRQARASGRLDSEVGQSMESLLARRPG